jgi:hypothetical protein
VLGGLPAIEALAREFGLWDKLRALRVLDPRQRTGSGDLDGTGDASGALPEMLGRNRISR